jgi:prevent-host-death family protein
MVAVKTHEADAQLLPLIARAEAGEDVVITRNGKPVVRLVPVAGKSEFAKTRGVLKGKIWMADDFDEWTDELQELFGLK